jgi:hypothetical protein
MHADDHGMLRVFRVHASASDTEARHSKRKSPNDLVVLHLLTRGRSYSSSLFLPAGSKNICNTTPWPSKTTARAGLAPVGVYAQVLTGLPAQPSRPAYTKYETK